MRQVQAADKELGREITDNCAGRFLHGIRRWFILNLRISNFGIFANLHDKISKRKRNGSSEYIMEYRTMKIISGGQTGADRAALDAAIELGIPHGGWLPRGRKTEDGQLPRHYRLNELDTYRYRDRTLKNVEESDGTLIVSFGPLTGGSALTEAFCIRLDRPYLHLNMEYLTMDKAVSSVEQWLAGNCIRTLNVAGPRASSDSRIYDAVRKIVLKINWRALDTARN